MFLTNLMYAPNNFIQDLGSVKALYIMVHPVRGLQNGSFWSSPPTLEFGAICRQSDVISDIYIICDISG